MKTNVFRQKKKKKNGWIPELLLKPNEGRNNFSELP